MLWEGLREFLMPSYLVEIKETPHKSNSVSANMLPPCRLINITINTGTPRKVKGCIH
ncbi:unknown protein [Microcystis aeruginosa NIES-843]|uniref:Uncharacterized protein n=1 Tax=Microcystis aeruginosa (strain NIES-843 / IAM M-2473) TaxID=449447 RepID=B0JUT5_MICAN|nr:unknown protein [Microcystis aeruginosa NIES-843]